MFNSKTIKTDVTSLHIYNNLLLSGIGGFLHIFELNTHNLLCRRNIFEGHKIYGIITSANRRESIIYGGKNIAIISNLENLKELIIKQSHLLSDWILDAKWIDNDRNIATIFMHNKVTVWSENFVKLWTAKCEEKCILYSAKICHDYTENMLILSGTVFSDILLWKPHVLNSNGESPVLTRLKHHNGVIFNIDYNQKTGCICSASDDRSAILWKILNKECLEEINQHNSENLRINISCQVYGHLSRVFRCCILEDGFVTAGEDSSLIIWDFKGGLLRKIDNHQGSVWSLAYNHSKNILCSGGNNGAISKFNISATQKTTVISLLQNENPKHVGLLFSQNIISITEKAVFNVYNKKLEKINEIAIHKDLQNYNIMAVSSCRKMVALAGFSGQIYIYQEINNVLKELTKCILKNCERIYSFHWLNCRTFLICQNEGKMSLCVIYKKRVCIIQRFVLPYSKERWSTCAISFNEHIVIGDRKGNIYNYVVGQETPLNSCKKAHSNLGVSYLCSRNNNILSLGKDGVLKKYIFYNGLLTCIESTKTKLSWLAYLEENYLIAFSANNFIISDYQFQRVLFEYFCGGGHRSWSFLNSQGNFMFAFIKQKSLNLIEANLDDYTPKDIIQGYHVKEINSIQSIVISKQLFLISGGEDTVLRISVLDNNSNIKLLYNSKVHLSSIRVISVCNLINKINEYMIFSAGGRAQIISWHLSIEFNDHNFPIVTCSEKGNFYEPLREDEAENRIMDLAIIIINNEIFLFSGCSDGYIKIYLVDDNLTMTYKTTLTYKHTCITKLLNVSINKLNVLVSMATDGHVVFWNTFEIINEKKINPISGFKIHQSGISSTSYRIINNNKLLLMTCGDDNSVVFTLFEIIPINNKLEIKLLDNFVEDGIHCAQITGAYINNNIFLTSSIDQRVVLGTLCVSNNKITVKHLNKYNSAIADQQGLDCLEDENSLNIFVYGNGVEYMKVNLENL
ncbi:WD repeat-containing protein 6 [Sitophilus oryzae]|uniref:tRNA (34-2'-O)-methyltransferase regulator WDR6 n=1 Tax=Sitophilus oryzae TaxID=7048 RepID=A0A6J2XZ53_SITOR|nr:WD repeat-containing protein 6 [Sitophilus oryzae]